MRKTNQLSALKIMKLSTPGRYGDGLGLWLQVSKTGTKAWLFRYQRAGAARQMGLGPLHTVSLADARERATECRKLLLAGVDPIDAARERRAQAALAVAAAVSFEDCAKRYIAAHSASWRNEKHREQWSSTLTEYAYPVIGALPVGDVGTGHVLQIIEPIWKSKAETAGRVRGRIELVLDWATARGHRSGLNVARWRGHLDKLLPARSKIAPAVHHPALPYTDAPAFAAALRKHAGMSARALEFLLLTAARTTAVIGATLDEIDMKAKMWTVPPTRAGVKIIGEDPRPRRVPLSRRAIAIIKEIERQQSRFVFPGAKPHRGLSNMAMLELMRELRPGFVPHGLRSTFKDWCSETTNYPNEVSEAALWHVVADKTEAAYRRGDLLEKRRELMEEWAGFAVDTNDKKGSPVAAAR